jgi:hypothetical protein
MFTKVFEARPRSASGVADTKSGTLVAPNLVAPNHSHHFISGSISMWMGVTTASC